MQRRPNRRRWTRAVLALALLPLIVGGCGGSDDNPPFIPPPTPDTTPPVLTATPAEGWFAATVNVELTATDNRDPAPVIHYTTDLTIPDETSPVYAAPIAITADTVVKAFAIDAAGNASATQVLGYVIASFELKQQWAQSGHGMIAQEPWRHWDADGEVPRACAKCHSADGYRDYAMDGTVDAPAPLPLGLDCNGCHENIPQTLYDDLAMFPDDAADRLPLGRDGHAERQQQRLHGLSPGPRLGRLDRPGHPGQPGGALRLHQHPLLRGGGHHVRRRGPRWIPVRRPRVPGAERLPQPHRELQDLRRLPHAGRRAQPHVRARCQRVQRVPRRRDLRDPGRIAWNELHLDPDAARQPLRRDPGVRLRHARLPDRVRRCRRTRTSSTISTTTASRDPDEVNFGNRYTQFDAALLKAAYNYQVAQKEPCGYIHNGTYIQQILYDSTVDLGGTASLIAPGRPGFDLLTASQTQQWQLSGHGDTYAEAFNHWNADGEIPEDCAKCHSTPGFIDYAADGTVGMPVHTGSTVECTACHASPDLFANAETRWAAQDTAGSGALLDIVFPSEDTASLGGPSNMCMACHSGRESGADVQDTIDAGPGPYTFINIHYYAAAATYFGSDVNGAYEYAGQTYQGQVAFAAHGGVDARTTCTGCHMRGDKLEHVFLPQPADCLPCHTSASGSFTDLTGSPSTNYNAIQTSLTELYAAIQAYANGTIGVDIAYDSHAYPYFFNDLNGNGVVDPDEANFGNRYVSFDASLLAAAYNYQVALKDPGGYIHNGKYTRQYLYDSIVDLGGTPTGTRP